MGVTGERHLVVYCPKKGISLRQQFINKILLEMGYDVITKPVSREICGSNPVYVVLDEWEKL